MEINRNIELIIMIGLPGSGKTTFITTLSQYFTDQVHEEKAQYEVHVISYDELIPISIQRGSDEVTSWKRARKKVLQQAETLVEHLKENTLLKKNNQHPNHTLIFVDDNMYYRSMRYEFFQLARSYGLSFCQLYMSCTIEEAIENNSTRLSDSVSSEVIVRMSTRLQPPDTVHNKWEHNSLTIDLHNIDFHNIYKLIKSSLNHPVSPIVQQPLLEGKFSLIHKADLELRKLVGRVMKGAPGDKEQLCLLAASLNSLRHSVLDRLRAGDMTLPEEDIPDFLAHQMGVDVQ